MLVLRDQSSPAITTTAKSRFGPLPDWCCRSKNGQGFHEKSVTQVKEPINHVLMLAAQPLTA
jgi:hypothetical protein